MSWESELTQEEVVTYKHYFSIAAKDQPNVVNGMEAVHFFSKSGLSNDLLSQIWKIADKKNLGYITIDSFAIALKLIACFQNDIKPVKSLFATITPLPKLKDIQLTIDAPITPNDKLKYQSIYQAQKPTEYGIPLDSAKAIFQKSKLSNEQLDQIWKLAYIRKSDYINETEFVVAMHYIANIMNKSITQIPSILPTDVYLAASSKKTIEDSVITDDIIQQEKLKYDVVFKMLDTLDCGVITADQAKSFFVEDSKVTKSELAEIWQLADIRKTGALNASEFALAMHLIKRLKAGQNLPAQLPKSLYTFSAPMQQDKSLFKDMSSGLDNQVLVEEIKLLQNEIARMKTSTHENKLQKLQAEHHLEILQDKRRDVSAQIDQLKHRIHSQHNELKDKHEKSRHEEPAWLYVRSEHNIAEIKLKKAHDELSEMKQNYQNNQEEIERLRRYVYHAQKETVQFTRELQLMQQTNDRKPVIECRSLEEKNRVCVPENTVVQNKVELDSEISQANPVLNSRTSQDIINLNKSDGDENEFVMIDHPKAPAESQYEPVLTNSQEEDEPVLVSPLSESDISIPKSRVLPSELEKGASRGVIESKQEDMKKAKKKSIVSWTKSIAKKKKKQTSTLQTTSEGIILQLLNMGFDEKEAMEALDRYDQDLEKAIHYLLDQIK